MSRITDLIIVDYMILSHCTDPACQKCHAQFRWLRRKGWRTSKTSVRKNTEGK